MTLALLLAAVVAAAQPAATDADDGSPRRFALAVGNNQGSSADAVLRYAERDARTVVDVLHEVGGVRREDAVLVLGNDADTVRQAVSRFERHLQAQARKGD